MSLHLAWDWSLALGSSYYAETQELIQNLHPTLIMQPQVEHCCSSPGSDRRLVVQIQNWFHAPM